MTEVVAYRIILVAAMVLLALVASLTARLTKKPLPWQEWATVTSSLILCFCAFFMLTVSGDADKKYEAVSATVHGKGLGPNGETILTVATGLDELKINVTCLPEQLGCQGAQLNDVVLMDGGTDFTGWVRELEVRYIYPAPSR